MTTDLKHINQVASSSDEPIERDLAWAVMVDLDPDEFTAEEQSVAQEILASSDQVESWSDLRINLSRIKRNQEHILTARVGQGILTDHQRAQLQKMAENIARESSLSVETRARESDGWFRFLIALRSPVFAWSAVVGLSFLGLWSYQTQLQDTTPDIKETIAYRGAPTSSPSALLEEDKDQPISIDHQSQGEDALEREVSASSDTMAETDSAQKLVSTKTTPFKTSLKTEISFDQSANSGGGIKSDQPSTRSSSGSDRKRVKPQAKKQRVSAKSPTRRSRRPASMRRSIPEKGKQSRSGYDQDEISHLGQSKGSDQAAYDSVPEPHQAPQEVVQREPMVSEQSAVTSSSITSTQKAPPAARSAPAQEPLDQAQVSLNRVIRLWGEGERKTALKALMKWLDENPSHAQRGNVLRLGISWAQELNDQEALSQLQPRTGSSPKAKKKRQQSMPQADESSGKDIMGY